MRNTISWMYNGILLQRQLFVNMKTEILQLYAIRIIVFLVWMVSGFDWTDFFYKFIWQGYYNNNVKNTFSFHCTYTNKRDSTVPLQLKNLKLFRFIYVCLFRTGGGGIAKTSWATPLLVAEIQTILSTYIFSKFQQITILFYSILFYSILF